MKKYQNYNLTKQQLEELYLNQKLGTKIISNMLKIPRGILRGFLRRYNIPVRSSPARIMDLTNKKFNSLTVIKLVGKTSKKAKIWECLCDCGNICKYQAYEIKGGYIKSCGCSHFRCNNNSPLWKGYGEISSQHFNSIKNHAKSRNIEFNITIEEMWNLFLQQNRKCALTGLILEFKKSHKDTKTASLDRIDSNKFYTIDNIQWVHKDINCMKMDLSNEEFYKYCKLVADHKLSPSISHNFSDT